LEHTYLQINIYNQFYFLINSSIMKKALFAALMLTTLGISSANAKSNLTNKEIVSVNSKANSALCYYTVVTYCRQYENRNIVTYKVTTTYLFCYPVCIQKTRVSCEPANNGGGCSGGDDNSGTGGGTGGMG
jgi:hypothetical protein